MNRREFLRAAAMGAAGATSGIILSSVGASELIENGGTILTEEAITNPGKIITSEDLVDEAVDIAKFGDNVAELLLRAKGPLTFYPVGTDFGGKHGFRVFGDTYGEFKQNANIKLAQGNQTNRF
jgi:hypothetical protein